MVILLYTPNSTLIAIILTVFFQNKTNQQVPPICILVLYSHYFIRSIARNLTFRKSKSVSFTSSSSSFYTSSSSSEISPCSSYTFTIKQHLRTFHVNDVHSLRLFVSCCSSSGVYIT